MFTHNYNYRIYIIYISCIINYVIDKFNDSYRDIIYIIL